MRTIAVEPGFLLPGDYDGFVFGERRPLRRPATDERYSTLVTVPPGGEIAVDVAHKSRGQTIGVHAFVSDGVGRSVEFLELVANTNFEGRLPAWQHVSDGEAFVERRLDTEWKFGSLVTGQHIGIDLIEPTQPGTARRPPTVFAPVSLLFFLTVMVILGVLSGQNLHPVNYGFLSAAFFAFHLLLAYLVDHISIHTAFLLASLVSVFLVVSPARGRRHSLRDREGRPGTVRLPQVFSYAFFFEGYTGLTVTVGAILTLFVMMQATARVDWGAVFAQRVGREA